MNAPLHRGLETATESIAPHYGRYRRRLRQLQKGIDSSYDTFLQRITLDSLVLELRRVRDVDALLDRLPPIQFRPDERLPFWADLWPSAIALAQYLWRTVDVQGLQVLELGCGMALAGIVAGRKGAAITLTDYDADALAFARYNALWNGCGQAIVRYLNWHSPNLTRTYELIIASDVLYERANFPSLLSMLQTSLAPHGQFILAEPNRPVAKGFFRLLRDHGFRYQRSTEQVDTHGERCAVSIYHGSRRIDRRESPAEGGPALNR